MNTMTETVDIDGAVVEAVFKKLMEVCTGPRDAYAVLCTLIVELERYNVECGAPAKSREVLADEVWQTILSIVGRNTLHS